MKKRHKKGAVSLSFGRRPRRRKPLARLVGVGIVSLSAIAYLGVDRLEASHEASKLSPETVTTITLPVAPVDTKLVPLVEESAVTRPSFAVDDLPIEPLVASTAENLPQSPPAAISQPEPTDIEDGHWLEAQVASGDNLSLIFGRLGLSRRDLHDILSAGGDAELLKKIFPGQTLRIRADGESVEEVTFAIDHLRTLHINRVDGGFNSGVVEATPDVKVRAVAGQIDSSLFLAGHDAGLSDSVIMELAAVFAWDVDFVLDIRKGDGFSVVYNEYWHDGKKLKDGDIVAAEFVTQGRTIRAIRYEVDGRSSYFSDEGKNMRKAFLRTPVNFSRISSRFNLKRKHPILNRIRAHKGVDYAAPHGTPIYSTGDGKVVFAGTKGGYGNTIVVQHGGRYSTLYAHMARFARGVRAGERVAQGQTIGYVGKSGLATGPHLHYEFHVDGVHRDPLAVKFPTAEAIPQSHIENFRAAAAPLLAQLDTLAEARDSANDSVLVAQLDGERSAGTPR